MKRRVFGKTGIKVSEIGLGTWQIGGDWSKVSDDDAISLLKTAIDSGVTFIDTADVYGSGRSETIIGKTVKDIDTDLFIATKVGRWSEPGWPENFTYEAMNSQIEASLTRLGVDALDLVQLHCIPTEELQKGEVFEHLRKIKSAGKIKQFGVSVETMEEADICLQHDDVASLQIIFNVLRQKPIQTLFDQAKAKQVALIVRLPLASGLLSGKMTKDTKFAEDDHRNYNRDGQKFNVGETFSGLPFEKGVDLIEELRPLVPDDMTMPQFALRWVLDHDAVTTVIPGASKISQVESNVSVSSLNPLSDDLHANLEEFYANKVEKYIRGGY
ncbi:MAG: aldo/keto reductase [Candidatus Saccharimonadales bacterium]|nr:aldo/keto reductase [Candidatus Saccharimonadales bacterium]